MEHNFCFSFNRNNTGGKSILNKKYLLYGAGKTTMTIKQYFDLLKVTYEIFDDYRNSIKEINLETFDYIIKSPGIKFDTKLLEIASLKQIKVISDLELFYLLNKEYEYIIITGTNGKTTTSVLVYQMLEYLPFFKNGLGGNIGTPLFSLLNQNRNNRGMVIEASSFTLHSTYNVHPSVYVITNLLPHHLDYHLTKKAYYFDKTKLIHNMNEFDYLIFNKDCLETNKLITNYKVPIKLCFSCYDKSADIYFDGNSIKYKQEEYVTLDDLNLSEKTVIMDMMVAILIAKIYHIPNSHIKKVLKSFNGVKFRLEKIYDYNNIVIYNDAKSTSPEALYNAMESIANNYSNHHKVLIIGGRMIDADYRKVNTIISCFDKVYLYGESKEELYHRLNHQYLIKYDNLDEVINDIKLVDYMVILFSPSCVSYDQFDSFEARGKKFNILIENKLKM